jgi:hypothetical protein
MLPSRLAFVTGGRYAKPMLNLQRSALAVLLTLLPACSGLLLHYYDPTTYKNLTDLKPVVSALYDSFPEARTDKKEIAEVRLKLAQAYEYEKGKGESNTETANQIKIIRDMFERHLQDRMKNGRWSKAHLENAKENMEDAFDIAIATERLKNKNE